MALAETTECNYAFQQFYYFKGYLFSIFFCFGIISAPITLKCNCDGVHRNSSITRYSLKNHVSLCEKKYLNQENLRIANPNVCLKISESRSF